MGAVDFFWIALLVVIHICIEKYLDTKIENTWEEIRIHASKFKLHQETHPEQLYSELNQLLLIKGVESYSFIALIIAGTLFFPIFSTFAYCVELFAVFSVINWFFFYNKTRNLPSVLQESKIWKRSR